jgi:hypothetical protein
MERPLLLLMQGTGTLTAATAGANSSLLLLLLQWALATWKQLTLPNTGLLQMLQSLLLLLIISTRVLSKCFIEVAVGKRAEHLLQLLLLLMTGGPMHEAPRVARPRIQYCPHH